MIYNMDREIDWKKRTGLTEIEKEVKDQIEEIRTAYFGEDTMGVVKLIYPRGEPERGENGELLKVFGVMKKFPIELKSADGAWRYSPSRPIRTSKGLDFPESHKFVTFRTPFREKDIEFVWFLIHHSSFLNNKHLYIEDLEKEAQKEIEEIASVADIQHAIAGKTSPIANDETLLREVAEVFGLKDVNKKKIGQIKTELLNEIIEGQKRNDRFINYEKFEELTQGNTKRKAAYVARKAIEDGMVKYKMTDHSWYIVYGRDMAEKLITIKAGDTDDRNEVLINEVVSNINIRSRLYDAVGEVETYYADDLRQMDKSTLQTKASLMKDVELKTTDTKEDIIKKICEATDIKYTPKSA